MKRCPDCGFRTEEKICPLCGVRTKDCEIPTHLHMEQAPCMLEQPRQTEQVRQMEQAQQPRPTYHVTKSAKGNGPAMLIVKIILAVIAFQILGTILNLIF